MCTLTASCSFILPPFGPGFCLQCSLLHVLAVFKSSDQVSVPFLHLTCQFFFMLPSCGLFSVNLLMIMSANDRNHVQNRFEKEKLLYSHWFLSSYCLLLIAGKISGLEYSFTLTLFLLDDSYGLYFLAFALLPWILLTTPFLGNNLSKHLIVHHMQVCCLHAKRTGFPQNVRLEIQRPFTCLTFAITDMILF